MRPVSNQLKLSTIFDKVILSGMSYPVGSFPEMSCQIDAQSDNTLESTFIQVILC